MNSSSHEVGRRGVTLLLLATVVGCVPLTRRSAVLLDLPDEYSARLPILQGWSYFELTGKISITRAEERLMAKLRWSQRDARSRVQLDGPLGVGGSELEWVAGEDPPVFAALERQLGVALPAASLRYWLLGVPDPTVLADTFELAGERLVRLQQAGWALHYRRYAPVAGAGFDLPARIDLERAGLSLRLVIDSWGGFRP